jgi:CRISPR-associated protein Cas6
VAGHRIRLGVPQVRALVPAPSLVARLVTIKGFTEADPFLQAARRQLDALGVAAELSIPGIGRGRHAGKLRRHVLQIKERRVVGYTLQATHLTAEGSLRLQERGLGGRRRMGCGFFAPVKRVGV